MSGGGVAVVRGQLGDERGGPSTYRRQPPRDHRRNLTKRSRCVALAAACGCASGSTRVSKRNVEPSACSSASLTVTGSGVAATSASKARTASTAGRKAGSRAGVMRGAMSGSEACVSIRMTNPAGARSEGAPPTEPTRRPGSHRPAAHDIIGPTIRGTARISPELLVGHVQIALRPAAIIRLEKGQCMRADRRSFSRPSRRASPRQPSFAPVRRSGTRSRSPLWGVRPGAGRTILDQADQLGLRRDSSSEGSRAKWI